MGFYNTVSMYGEVFIMDVIIIIILLLWEFFTPPLADGFS